MAVRRYLAKLEYIKAFRCYRKSVALDPENHGALTAAKPLWRIPTAAVRGKPRCPLLNHGDEGVERWIDRGVLRAQLC